MLSGKPRGHQCLRFSYYVAGCLADSPRALLSLSGYFDQCATESSLRRAFNETRFCVFPCWDWLKDSVVQAAGAPLCLLRGWRREACLAQDGDAGRPLGLWGRGWPLKHRCSPWARSDSGPPSCDGEDTSREVFPPPREQSRFSLMVVADRRM